MERPRSHYRLRAALALLTLAALLGAVWSHGAAIAETPEREDYPYLIEVDVKNNLTSALDGRAIGVTIPTTQLDDFLGTNGVAIAEHRGQRLPMLTPAVRGNATSSTWFVAPLAFPASSTSRASIYVGSSDDDLDGSIPLSAGAYAYVPHAADQVDPFNTGLGGTASALSLTVDADVLDASDGWLARKGDLYGLGVKDGKLYGEVKTRTGTTVNATGYRLAVNGSGWQSGTTGRGNPASTVRGVNQNNGRNTQLCNSITGIFLCVDGGRYGVVRHTYNSGNNRGVTYRISAGGSRTALINTNGTLISYQVCVEGRISPTSRVGVMTIASSILPSRTASYNSTSWTERCVSLGRGGGTITGTQVENSTVSLRLTSSTATYVEVRTVYVKVTMGNIQLAAGEATYGVSADLPAGRHTYELRVDPSQTLDLYIDGVREDRLAITQTSGKFYWPATTDPFVVGAGGTQGLLYGITLAEGTASGTQSILIDDLERDHIIPAAQGDYPTTANVWTGLIDGKLVYEYTFDTDDATTTLLPLAVTQAGQKAQGVVRQGDDLPPPQIIGGEVERTISGLGTTEPTTPGILHEITRLGEATVFGAHGIWLILLLVLLTTILALIARQVGDLIILSMAGGAIVMVGVYMGVIAWGILAMYLIHGLSLTVVMGRKRLGEEA